MKAKTPKVMTPEQRNKWFNGLSDAGKRVAIAQDVIDQIKLDKYLIQTGTWLDIDIEYPEPDYSKRVTLGDLDSQQVQEMLTSGVQGLMIVPEVQCNCCAIGAACASAVRLSNKDNLLGGHGVDDFQHGLKILSRFFSKDQCRLIEACFELRLDEWVDGKAMPLKELLKAREWYDNYEGTAESDRAIAIFTNIVKNKGTFIP